jgi:hypothetical protein
VYVHARTHTRIYPHPPHPHTKAMKLPKRFSEKPRKQDVYSKRDWENHPSHAPPYGFGSFSPSSSDTQHPTTPSTTRPPEQGKKEKRREHATAFIPAFTGRFTPWVGRDVPFQYSAVNKCVLNRNPHEGFLECHARDSRDACTASPRVGCSRIHRLLCVFLARGKSACVCVCVCVCVQTVTDTHMHLVRHVRAPALCSLSLRHVSDAAAELPHYCYFTTLLLILKPLATVKTSRVLLLLKRSRAATFLNTLAAAFWRFFTATLLLLYCYSDAPF